MEFKFANQMMTIIKAYYQQGGGVCLRVVDEAGWPYATLTSNPYGLATLEPGEYLIKTHSENKGVARAVLESGLFVDTKKRVPSGFVVLEVWREEAS